MQESIVKTDSDQLLAFERRMEQRREAEAEREAQKTEQLRGAYLKRTGRKEIKP